ncbi:hypothetical protein [uncultured Bradyrhizobium sp.]|jgi:hypothetical protein|uniref:hypothetical protein n=1 Tax=uncultured Bradyrhizobium sp. TaxID=199684 RepID=UPI002615AF68|nr:hypothetical protein [uncultured Bradyrhizobium sp.]
MSKAKSGGGITSNKVVQSRGVKTGANAKGISPQSVARIGMQVVTGTGIAKVPGPISKPLGNELAKNVGKGGPGVGRTVHTTGSQSNSPVASPMTSPGGWPWSKGN